MRSLITIYTLSTLLSLPCPTLQEVSVIFVIPMSNRVEIDHSRSLESIERSLLFWEDLSPEPISFEVTEVSVITPTQIVTDGIMWSESMWDPPTLTIFVIETSEYLDSDKEGLSWREQIWVRGGDSPNFEATLTHEVGHAIFDLPHQYHDASDIMGLFPLSAYLNHQIGCSSLEVMGHPCRRVYLPMIGVSI